MKRHHENWKALVIAAAVSGSGGIAAAQQGQSQGEAQQGQGQSGQGRQMQAPIAGTQPIGVTVQEAAIVARGWSSKKDLLHKAVYNDKGDKIGTIDDIIVGPDKTASFAVVATGGFVGIDKHNVAIPFSQLQTGDNRITLPGATKDALKSLPEFQYAR